MKHRSHSIFLILLLVLGLSTAAEVSFDIDPPKTDSSKSISADTIGINLDTDVSKTATDDTLVFEDWDHPLKQQEKDLINCETLCDGKARFTSMEVLEIKVREPHTRPLPQGEAKEQSIAELVVYPNPVQSTLFIRGMENITLVNILNYKGEILKSVANSTQINVSELHSGVYLVRIETSDGIAVKKFIKH